MRVVSSWCSCVPRPALGKISVIHSRVASFGRVAGSSQPLLGSWVSGSSACCGPRWGWQNSTCDQMLLPSGYLCFLVCKVDLADDWGWPPRGTFLLSTCQSSGLCHQYLWCGIKPSVPVPQLLSSEMRITQLCSPATYENKDILPSEQSHIFCCWALLCGCKCCWR